MKGSGLITDHTLPSIESIGLPLAYKVDPVQPARMPASEAVTVLVEARALEGMQKEALVHHGPTITTWRMVSDEGPYLNGTDLAPFPLAFYAVGMAFSFLSELERHATAREVPLGSVSLEQGNFYTMQGSAIRGDMIGGALPAEIAISVESDASPEQIAGIVRLAEASSPAQSYVNYVLSNTFTLNSNGRPVPVADLPASSREPGVDPAPSFEEADPLSADEYAPEIITKRAAAELKSGVEGGAGSSLKSEQKRTLHIHTEAMIRQDGLREATVRLRKPIGSSFHFISDERSEIAPPSLSYLAAGVGFCYMTQLGRYARIVKLDLGPYRIAQTNSFVIEGPEGKVVPEPVDTHLFITLNDSDEAAQKLLWMGERTCFLHAAMRSSNRSELSASLNGTPVELGGAPGK